MSLLKALASLKLTVACLLLLAVLVFWGTLYQVEYGLYDAQQRFFNSWLFTFAGFLPFPGTQGVLWVLFVNLLASMLLHFDYGWRHVGLLLIHAGLLLLLAGGFVAHQHAQESFLTLLEGDGSNVSSSYQEWEISVWQDEGARRQVRAVDADAFTPGQVVRVEGTGLEWVVTEYYRNCRAFRGSEGGRPEVVNASGIQHLEPAPRSREPNEDVPGGLFLGRTPSGDEQRFLLYGGDEKPVTVSTENGDRYHLVLRRKRLPLPMTVKLLDFRREMHPNSTVPRSFSSLVEIETPAGVREVLIEMNQPLRYQGHTLYQASYSEFEDGRQSSTFAVVLNYGRLLPYAASIITFLGLLQHFFIEGFLRRNGART